MYTIDKIVLDYTKDNVLNHDYISDFTRYINDNIYKNCSVKINDNKISLNFTDCNLIIDINTTLEYLYTEYIEDYILNGSDGIGEDSIIDQNVQISYHNLFDKCKDTINDSKQIYSYISENKNDVFFKHFTNYNIKILNEALEFTLNDNLPFIITKNIYISKPIDSIEQVKNLYSILSNTNIYIKSLGDISINGQITKSQLLNYLSANNMININISENDF